MSLLAELKRVLGVAGATNISLLAELELLIANGRC